MQRAWLAVSLLALGSLVGGAVRDPFAEANEQCTAALVAKRAGQYDLAEQLYKKALSLDPQMFDARWGLAWVYAEKGRKDLAAEQFRAVIAAVPGTTKATEATAGLTRLGQPVTVAPAPLPPRRTPAPEETRYQPTPGSGWRATPLVSAERAKQECAAGMIAKQAGNYDAAIEHFARALRFDPELGDAHWALGWVYAEKGDKPAAGNHFRQVLRFEAGTERAKAAVDALERLGLPAVIGRPELGQVDVKGLYVRSHRTIEGAARPLWTPDGALLVFTRAGAGLALADGDGSNPRLLAKGLRLTALSNDGKLAYAMPLGAEVGSLSTVRLIDGIAQPFAPTLKAKIVDVVPSPDSKALLVISEVAKSTDKASQGGVPAKAVLSVVSADGATVKSQPAVTLHSNPKWASDSSAVLWAAEGKIHVTSAAGEDKVVCDGAWCDWLSATGKILVRTIAGDLLVFGTQGGEGAKLVSTVKDLRVDRAWASPSGKWVLYRENGRSWGCVRVADQFLWPLGDPDRPISDAYWLAKSDQLMVADRSMLHSDDKLWQLFDPEVHENSHPVLQDAFIWGHMAISGDGKLAAYWQAVPNGLLASKAPAARLMFSGRLMVGSTESTSKLSPLRISQKSDGSGAGASWSSKGDAVAYWVPTSQQIGVVVLGKK